MITSDAVAYFTSAIVAFWIVYGTLRLSPQVLTIGALAAVVAIPVHWAFGLYTSIVRYMGLALIVVGVKATLLVTIAVMGTSE